MQLNPATEPKPVSPSDLSTHQKDDPECQQLLLFLTEGRLPEGKTAGTKVAAQESQFDLWMDSCTTLRDSPRNRSRSRTHR